MPDRDTQANVGFSEKWDAREAGKEVASKALEELESKPSFFVLFSTIHYIENGGFQELLNGVYDILPEDTPLVGGTVSGFTVPQGCYVHGAAGMAVFDPNMDVVLGVGYNTKRNPQEAAKQCVREVNDGLKNSKYKNRFLFDFAGGTEILDVPPVGRTSVIRSGILAKTIMSGFKTSQTVFQKGVGREDELLEEIVTSVPNCGLLHGSAIDDLKMLRNYQFANRKVLTNAVVCLGIQSDLNTSIGFAHGADPGVSFDVTKLSDDRHIVHEINNKPAARELLKLINWPEEFFDEALFVKRFPYFPLGMYVNGKFYVRPFVMILGDSILFMTRINKGKAYLTQISGSSMVHSVDEMLEELGVTQPAFGLFTSCAVRLMALGRGIFNVRDILLNHFKDKPFLLGYCGGEAVYTPEHGLEYLNESVGGAIFWR